jgi:hypothetical protein
MKPNSPYTPKKKKTGYALFLGIPPAINGGINISKASAVQWTIFGIRV